MKISVITVSYNAEQTIEATLRSVVNQEYSNVEHILVDGASSDRTIDRIEQYKRLNFRWISEPDDGIYHAMNKGLAMATGDVIGFLNADDVFADSEVLATVAGVFGNSGVDACYADLVYVRKDNPHKVVRYFSSGSFSPARLAFGQMPAHPTFYLRREYFAKYGGFKTDYDIAADYELVTRMFTKFAINAVYVPQVWVKMNMGGVSTRSWRSNIILNREILRACRENFVSTNMFKIYSKYPVKLLQMIRRPL